MQISFLNCWTTFTEENVQMFSRNSSTIIWNWCHRMNQNSKLTLAFFYAAFVCIRVIVDNDPVSMEQCPQAIEFISIRGCFCSCNGMLYFLPLHFTRRPSFMSSKSNLVCVEVFFITWHWQWLNTKRMSCVSDRVSINKRSSRNVFNALQMMLNVRFFD